MKVQKLACYFAILLSASTCFAQSSYVFTTIAVPGATYVEALGINNDGKVVGSYYDGLWHGFTYESGTLTSFDALPASFGINDSGQIVGYNADGSGNGHGFIYTDDGSLINIDVPEAKGTYPYSINNHGQIVGLYEDMSRKAHGFLYDSGTFTTIDVPGATGTWAQGINDSEQVVGWYMDASGTHGFIDNAGTVSTLNAPGSIETLAFGVNQSGEIAGRYVGASDYHSHGFVKNSDAFAIVDATWAVNNTTIMGINKNGQIVGYYSSSSGGILGFIGSPYQAFVLPPINSDGISVFKANRGVVPVKFRLTLNGASTCSLPAATISVNRTAGATIGEMNEGTYATSADNGTNFRIDQTACQYVYNLGTAFGAGAYKVDIKINGVVVGSAVFALK